MTRLEMTCEFRLFHTRWANSAMAQSLHFNLFKRGDLNEKFDH